jgi:protein kinase-like protein
MTARERERCLHDLELLTLADGHGDERLWDHVGACHTCATLVATAAASQGQGSTAERRGAVTTREHGYTLGREIARGGMGCVVLGRDLHLHRDVAIKLSTGEGGALDARFQREIAVTARLQHPNIIPVYDAGELDGAPFYAMRPVAGQRLDERISQARSREERLELLPHVIAVVDAIAYAHRQRVIHRDIKPQNVLVGEFGETVVIDWGLAKQLSADGATRPSFHESLSPSSSADDAATVAGSIIGTPTYMPPEQARGEAGDYRSDVYALGCLLFQTLTGELPHLGPPEVVLASLIDGGTVDLDRAPDLPPELRAIIAKATAADTAQRYRDAGELVIDLRRYQAGLLVAAHHYRWHQRLGRFVRRYRLAAAVVASVTVSAAIIGTIAIRRIVAERDRANIERTSATSLLGFLVDDLPNKLRSVGQVAVLEDAAIKLDAYFTAVVPARADSTEHLVKLAQIRSLRGEIAVHAGKAAEARALSEQALGFAREAEARGDPRAKVMVARQLLERGAVIQDTGNFDEARKVYEEGFARLDSLPPSPELRGMRGRAAIRLAGMAIDGFKFKDAEKWLAAARASLDSDGTSHDMIYEMSVQAIEYLDAQRLWSMRDLPGARAHIELAIAAARRATRISPWRSDGHDAEARARGMLGSIAFDQGDKLGAARAIHDATIVQRTLHDLDPDNLEWQESLASGLADLADVRDHEGSPPPPGEAPDELRREASALLDQVAAHDSQRGRQMHVQILRDMSTPASLDKAQQIAAGMQPGNRECALIDIARDRAQIAFAAKDRAGAFAQLDAAAAQLDALREAIPPCARFERFDITIDRAIFSPPKLRPPLLDQARGLAAKLRAEGLEQSLSEGLDRRIDEAIKAP